MRCRSSWLFTKLMEISGLIRLGLACIFLQFNKVISFTNYKVRRDPTKPLLHMTSAAHNTDLIKPTTPMHLERLISLEQFLILHKSFKTNEQNDLMAETLYPYDIIKTIVNASIDIANRISTAAIDGTIGSNTNTNTNTNINPSGEVPKTLDIICNEILINALKDPVNKVAYLASEEEDHLVPIHPETGKFIVAFDPLDGSSNLDCSIPTGTIFGIYHYYPDMIPPSPSPQTSTTNNEIKNLDLDFLLYQSGKSLIASGYIMYSSSTEFMLTLGDNSVHGFTLNRHSLSHSQQFLLTKPYVQVPPRGYYYSLNEGRSSDWPVGLLTYINNIKNGKGQAKGKRYSSRYVCSLVADVHRTILYGGWAGNPRRHLRLLFEAAPLAFLLGKH